LSQRHQQLDVTYNNVKLLTDILHHYQPDTAAESDKEIMKVFASCLLYAGPTAIRFFMKQF